MTFQKIKKDGPAYFISGIAFSIIFWLIESLTHIFLFKEGITLHALIPHDTNELWMRLVAVTIIMSSSFFAFSAKKRRNKLQTKLTASEKRFEDLVDTLPQTVFEADREGRITFVNRAALEIFGYTSEEISQGLTIIDIVAPQSKEKARRNMEKILNGERLKGSEYESRKKDGTLFPVLVYSDRIIKDGKVEGLRGVVFDITSIKEEREALKKMSFAVINSPVSVVITDPEGKIEYVNPQFTRITGYTYDEVAGKNSDLMKSGLTGPEVYEDLRRKLEAGEEWRGTLINRRKTGDIYWEEVRTSPVLDPEGKLLSFVEVREDITERKILLEKLISSERRFSSILNNMQDTYFRTDMEGRVIMLSPSVSDLLGYSPAELVGKHRSETFLKAFTSSEIMHTLKGNGGALKDMEAPLIHGKGHPVQISANIQYYYNDEGEIIGIEGTLRDISLRKTAEKKLELYAAELETSNRQKELYIDIMSHDILNPINTIMNAADILSSQNVRGKKESFIDMIRESSCEIEERINLARTYSRLTNTTQIDPVELDLNRVLERTIENFGDELKKKNVSIKFTPAPGSMIKGSKLIYDVMSNLLSNAIKYGPRGGTVEVGLEDKNNRWVAYVKDQGEGIANEDKDRVFKRFERLKKGGIRGSGLGLAIVKRIVDLHGGEIRVEDNPGGGASFKAIFLKCSTSTYDRQKVAQSVEGY